MNANKHTVLSVLVLAGPTYPPGAPSRDTLRFTKVPEMMMKQEDTIISIMNNELHSSNSTHAMLQAFGNRIFEVRSIYHDITTALNDGVLEINAGPTNSKIPEATKQIVANLELIEKYLSECTGTVSQEIMQEIHREMSRQFSKVKETIEAVPQAI